MRFTLVSLLSLSALALAAPAPEPAPQGNVAPTCSEAGDCASFCTQPCTRPFCGLSAFGDQRCFCGC
ncbi:hypothetical protein QIS74_08169 [Colletotrichum tabaci]|uniref:Uncharacterized protein n=2 Tax=Colletotrichum destructivum species complex TaxID=2707350 RepID=A0A4T0WLL8_9PEZI|nr:hypothetical protein CH35J_001013 [Colletotrichum higginsianum]